MAALRAGLDHAEDADARGLDAALAALGIDLDVLGAKLQHDGLAQFATAFAKMLELTA